MTGTQFLFSFKGRINRKQYWLHTLIIVGYACFISAITRGEIGFYGPIGILMFVPAFVLFYTRIPLNVKRLHDTNRSGWNYLYRFIPLFGGIYILCVCGFFKGVKEANNYGEIPSKFVFPRNDTIILLVSFFLLPIIFLQLFSRVTVESALWTASDELSQITAPTYWREIPDLNDDASLCLGYEDGERYVIIITEEIGDFIANGWEFSDFARITVESMTSEFENVRLSKPATIKINGHSALQYEFTGLIDGDTAEVIHTSVKGTTHFYQVVAVTGKHLNGGRADRLRDIIKSFRPLVVEK